jgi:hypothetical protein
MTADLLIEGKALPAWASWAAALGEHLADAPAAGSATVIAASLPTRSFAAVFAAVGACRAAARSISGHSRAEIEKWGTRTRVRFPLMGGFREGRIKAIGSRGVWVLQPNGTECLVPWARASGIERLPEGAEPTSRIRRTTPAERFRAAALGTDLAVPTDALDCLMVGTRHRLEEELELEVEIEGIRHRGTLAELVRPRSMFGRKSQFRSDIMSSAGAELPAKGRTGRIPLVILDGSASVLRWLGADWASPILCLIDRTEPRAEDAAAAVEARAAAGSRVAHRTVPDAPQGIETLAFARNSRRA